MRVFFQQSAEGPLIPCFSLISKFPQKSTSFTSQEAATPGVDTQVDAGGYVHVFFKCVCLWHTHLQCTYMYTMYKFNTYKAVHMAVSKNRGTPKWMVYKGKPY